MKKWCTTIRAICSVTGEMRTFAGPIIEAPSPRLAHEFCQNNGLGYCKIDGEFICEIPCRAGQTEPGKDAWDLAKDTQAVQYN